jgi:uncharacterized membrane protein YkvA (DUF1232 family)
MENLHVLYNVMNRVTATKHPFPCKEIFMTDRKSNKLMVPQGGVLRDFILRLKLIGRLMSDSRVNFFLKLIPIASLAYLISPIDLAPGVVLPVIGVLDDAAILWIGSTLFVELCPPEVVSEHQKQLASNVIEDMGDVVDAEVTDVNDDKQ